MRLERITPLTSAFNVTWTLGDWKSQTFQNKVSGVDCVAHDNLTVVTGTSSTYYKYGTASSVK